MLTADPRTQSAAFAAPPRCRRDGHVITSTHGVVAGLLTRSMLRSQTGMQPISKLGPCHHDGMCAPPQGAFRVTQLAQYSKAHSEVKEFLLSARQHACSCARQRAKLAGSGGGRAGRARERSSSRGAGHAAAPHPHPAGPACALFYPCSALPLCAPIVRMRAASPHWSPCTCKASAVTCRRGLPPRIYLQW